MAEARPLFPEAAEPERAGLAWRLARLVPALVARLRPWPREALTLEAGGTGGVRALTTAEVGDVGERVAGQFLVSRGYRVLWRNFRARGGGELDLVLRDGSTLVFCEVKTRAGRGWGRPADAVDREKRRYISKGAQGWLKALGNPTVPFRFDVVEVVLTKGANPAINHIRGAFSLSEPYLYS